MENCMQVRIIDMLIVHWFYYLFAISWYSIPMCHYFKYSSPILICPEYWKLHIKEILLYFPFNYELKHVAPTTWARNQFNLIIWAFEISVLAKDPD